MAPAIDLVARQNDLGCPNGQCGKADSSEKIYIGAGAGLCGAIVLGVGAALLYRRLRKRSKAKAEGDSSTTPMMSGFHRLNAPSTFSFHAPGHNSPQNTYQPPTRPPTSPLAGGGSAASSYHDSASSSSSGYSVKSPMSEHSSQFHFPLLSSDGHLLPPIPASSRQSWNITEGDLGAGRPLPPAPGTEDELSYEQNYDYPYSPDVDPYEVGKQANYHQQTTGRGAQQQLHSPVQLIAPTPSTPKRWSYVPPHSTPSPDRSDESVQQIVGLYPSIEFRRDGTIDYGYSSIHGQGVDDAASTIRSSPRVARVEDTFGFHQPQSATYHRSFSAEGEEIRADRP